MSEKWKFDRFLRLVAVMFVWLSFWSSDLCWSLNDEGFALLRFKDRVVSDPLNALSDWRDDLGEVDSCSWFGVECSDGKIVLLNLKDLCLGGTLAPELSQLVHIKSIVLRNNSFTGAIPEEIGELKELEVLDLGHNHFTGTIPGSLGNNLSLTFLLLDNNGLLGSLSPKLDALKMVSEFQFDENQLSGAPKEFWCNRRPNALNVFEDDESADRRMLQDIPRRGELLPPSPPTPSGIPITPPQELSPPPPPDLPPSPLPPPSTGKSAPSEEPAPPPPPVSSTNAPAPSTAPPPPPVSPTNAPSPKRSSNKAVIVGGAVGGAAAIVIIVAAYLCVKTKVTYVSPWATGLSGQLKKAFVTGQSSPSPAKGVPKLRRSEIETACEDFSNVIGSTSIGTLYKGTLSSGAEIAVACVAATSSKNWSENLELQYLKKIDTLSKVNHKNFVNLVGYCQEDEPFTRMMVFEYAPNGTLFEHLHIREAEHLDWGMRLRVGMGMAYCLDYMHQLEQPIPHNNLSSSSVRLTEDYAAKIAEFSFWSEVAGVAATESKSMGSKRLLSSGHSISPESNVYDFGVILFEMMTGRVPYSADNGSLENWASDYLRGDRPLKEIVDPTLSSYPEDQLEEIGVVIKSCVHPDPRRRPEMREVCIRMREVTGITPDGASPRISPMWWAELELMSDSM